jgi:hypothetical protein
MNEVTEELRTAIECIIIGKGRAGAPMIVILRRGTYRSVYQPSMLGNAEDEDAPVVVSIDPGLAKIRIVGAAGFPCMG